MDSVLIKYFTFSEIHQNISKNNSVIYWFLVVKPVRGGVNEVGSATLMLNFVRL